MPDFVGEGQRGSSKPGNRSKRTGPASTNLPRLQVRMVKKTSAIKRGASPLDTFRRLLDELRGGISSIARMKDKDGSRIPKAFSVRSAVSTSFKSTAPGAHPGIGASSPKSAGIAGRPNSAAIGEKFLESLNRVRTISVGKSSDPLGVKPMELPLNSGGVRHRSTLREVLHRTREFVPGTREFVPGTREFVPTSGDRPSGRHRSSREWPPVAIHPRVITQARPSTDRRPVYSSGGMSGAASPVRSVGFGSRLFDVPSKITAVTGADREAVRTVREVYRGHPTQFPAAARVAQILKADSLIKSGEARPNAQLQALAQAAREGRMRDVADVDPQAVQALFEESFGGQENAQRALYTPEVHTIVERQRMAVGMVQERVKGIRQSSKRRNIGELSVKTVHTYRKQSLIQQQIPFSPSIQPRGPSISETSGRAKTEPRVSHFKRSTEEKYSPALQAMAAHNDFAHLPMAMEDLNQGAEEEREIKGPDLKTVRDRRVNPTRRQGGVEKNSMERSPQEVSAPSLPSPSQKSSSPLSAMVKASKPSTQRLTGQLTLVTKEGLQLGTAEFEGSLG